MKALRLSVIGFAVAVCVFVAAASGSSTKSGGTFRVGTASGIDSLNPFVAFNQDAYSTFFNIYPVLVQYDKKLHFAPFFARSWHASNGGKTWTFNTQPNATWTDGQPLTAEDAAWTINTAIKYKKTGAANYAGLVAHITRADAPTPTTLVVHYQQAPGNVLGQFEQFFIVPKHIWETHTGHNGTDLKTFANPAPVVGSGPFKLVKFQKNQIALFQRNDSYWGVKPQIDVFGLQMYSNDDAMVSALKAHDLDALENIPPPSLSTLKKAGFTITRSPGLELTDFIINSNPKKKNHRELLNLTVKEAFDHAIDRKKIVSIVNLGAAQPAGSIIPASDGDWHNPNVKPTSFNLALANKLLDSVGFSRGSDGVRVANGQRMSYDVVTPTDVGSIPRAFQIIQADFAKIGVQLKQKALDSTAAFDLMSGPNNTYQGFDLAMWDWVGLADPDFMLSVVTCAQYGGWSDSGFCDKKYDALYAKQQLTPNQLKRKAIVWQMQSYLAKQRPYLWLVQSDSVSAVAPNWVGFSSGPQGPFNEMSIASLTQVHQK